MIYIVTGQEENRRLSKKRREKEKKEKRTRKSPSTGENIKLLVFYKNLDGADGCKQ